MFDSQPGIAEIAIVFVAIAYVVSLVKDWRPIRSLRSENHELRKELTALQARFSERGKTLDEALQKIAALEKSRDFTSAFDEALSTMREGAAQSRSDHERIMGAISTRADETKMFYTEVLRALSANTAVLSTLADNQRASIISKNLVPPTD